MSKKVTDDCGLKFSREPLDIEVVFDPILISTGLLLDDPAWPNLLTTEINNALVIPNVLQRTLHNWVIQSILSAFVADEACWDSDKHWHSKYVLQHIY
jgi:hypothetical protein